MKKFLVVSLAVLALAAVAPQPAAAGFGLKGGLAFSTFNFNFETPGLYSLKAPMGGVFWGFNLGLFTIQPEALYVRMGARMEEGADWMEARLDYIQVPVLLKINLLPGPVSPMIYAGPYLSFLISAKGVQEIGGVSESFDIKDGYTSTDYGLVFGGGLDFRLVAVKISAEVRYNLGMTNIAKDPGEDFSQKNQSLMFLVGISF